MTRQRAFRAEDALQCFPDLTLVLHALGSYTDSWYIKVDQSEREANAYAARYTTATSTTMLYTRQIAGLV